MASKRKIQKENNSTSFSEDELDAARQLVQLSCSSEEYEDDTKDGLSEASSSLRLQHNYKTDNNDDADDDDDDDEEDGGLKRKIKRFRSVKSIYRSTKPLVVEFGGNKTKCKCN